MTTIEKIQLDIQQKRNNPDKGLSINDIIELLEKYKDDEKNQLKESFFFGLFEASKFSRKTMDEIFEKFYQTTIR